MRLSILPALLLTLLVGCGGQVDAPAGDLGPSAFPVCPADPPEAGVPCSTPGQGCRYIDLRGGCEAYACDAPQSGGSTAWRGAPEGC